MHTRHIGLVAACIGLVGTLALASPAGAQTLFKTNSSNLFTGTTAGAGGGGGGGMPSGGLEAWVKYVFMHDEGESAPAGFELDLTKRVVGDGKSFGVGVGGDFGVSHFSGATDKWFVGGAQFYPPMNGGNIQPFAQVSYGESFFGNGDNAGTLKFGGGIRDSLKSPNLIIVVQVNIVRLNFDGGSSTGVQVEGGVIIVLGK